MQQMRSRRRLVTRLGVGIAITFLAAQFRPAKGKGPCGRPDAARERSRGDEQPLRRR